MAKLAAALDDALNDPAVREQLASSGADPSRMSPADFRALIASELEIYGAIVAEMN
ncbi:MAG: hypothetical protein EA356_03125 [Geminicoccaceae bacterium]|nr:MAG: hypothetical protein EA356_03125 [Geminicoccaceae bacterium]